MSFIDDIKRSLGFEETESGRRKNGGPGLMDTIMDVIKPKDNAGRPQTNHQQSRPNPQQQSRPNAQYQHRQAPRPTQSPNPRPQPNPMPFYDDYEVIVPEQSFYEIVLIRPKTIDDINYVVDQVVAEQNPVILDLSFLEKESAPNFKLAGDKIKQIRAKHGAQALLLEHTEDKHLIIVSPKKVKVINKG